MEFITKPALEIFEASNKPEWHNFFMRWETPVVFAVVYVVLEFIFSPKSSGTPEKRERSIVRNLPVIIHNIILAIFSIAVFLLSFPLFRKRFEHGFTDEAYCDKDGSMMNGGMRLLGYVFYLSKFYEVGDTIILLCKGRKPSMLQVYHHAGAVIGMWGLVYTDNVTVWVFVCLNSFIHSIMYTYFAVACFGIGSSLKMFITSLQLIQFVLGNILCFNPAFNPCFSEHQRWAVQGVMVYTWGLIVLFGDFYRRTYFSSAKPKREEKKKQ